MLFWGAIASAAVGILGGGGGGGIIGDIFGGIFGGGGGSGGIGGWLGGLFENLFGGLFGDKREEAASRTVNQEFARQQTPERTAQGRTTREPAGESDGETIAAPQGEPTEEGCCCCCCHDDAPSEEAPSESPSGGLEVEGDVVTTEGGYEIEMLGPTEWKITGPDGTWTRIWGDPHVEEGDRNGATSEGNGGWDFKDSTTFVLGDGTEIHVTTVPRDNGTTVTGQLNIVNGDHAVEVTGVDKGKGQIGEVTTNGEEISHQYSGYQDVYQGAEADDWSYNGREIVGSRGKGEEFVLDDEMEPGTEIPEVPAVDEGIDDGTGDGLDASLFEPMSLVFNIGDYSISFGIEENDQAQA